MKFEKLIRGLAPIAAIAFAASLSGCKDMNIRINDEEGVPLAELDLSGDPPSELVLAGPDTVVVTDGARLDIDVEGDTAAVEALRFTLSDGTLGILREGKSWSRDDGVATVRVTMPSPAKVVIAGSGGVAAQSLAREAEVTIAGSGRLELASVEGGRLNVSIAGSGRLAIDGQADELELSIAGSGSCDAEGLVVEKAAVHVAGSGDAIFGCNGEVTAHLMGSGNVIVRGAARCEVHSMGSGTLTCERERESAH